MKKLFYFIKENYPIVIAIAVIVALIVGVCIVDLSEAKSHSASSEKGTGYCPVCGEKLVKGVWGAYTPHFIWYCPNCP